MVIKKYSYIFVIFVCLVSTVYARVNLRHNRLAIKRIRNKLNNKTLPRKRRAILKGLRWCIKFVNNDDNFEFIFSDYMTMLHELYHSNKQDKFMRSTASYLIKKGARRAEQHLEDIFPDTRDAQWDLISVLPILHQVGYAMEPYYQRYREMINKSNVPDYPMTLEQAAEEKNYDVLSDYFVDYAFLDFAYNVVDHDRIDLPDNTYQEALRHFRRVPLLWTKNNEDAFHDQNYYVTHVICSLTRYAALPLKKNRLTQRMLSYLKKHFDTVRYELDDIDLLGEYIQCFKMYGLAHWKPVKQAERKLLSRQYKDGSWRNPPDKDDDPYDIFHPVWTSIIALQQA